MHKTVVLAVGYDARNFTGHFAMKLRYDPKNPSHHARTGKQYESHLVIAGQDIPTFCRALLIANQRASNHYERVLIESLLRTDVSFCGIEANGMKKPPTRDLAFFKELLEPFRRLHSLKIKICGHISLGYRKIIETSASKEPLHGPDSMEKASKLRVQGLKSVPEA